MKTSILASLSLVPALVACVGGRTPETYQSDVTKLIATKNDQVVACYAAALKDNPSVAGNVTLRFRLNYAGEVHVNEPRALDLGIVHNKTTVPLPLAECTLKAIREIKLAPPDKMAEVLWTWKFAPDQAPSATLVPTAAAVSTAPTPRP